MQVATGHPLTLQLMSQAVSCQPQIRKDHHTASRGTKCAKLWQVATLVMGCVFVFFGNTIRLSENEGRSGVMLMQGQKMGKTHVANHRNGRSYPQ